MTEQEQPKVAVIVVTWNQKDLCLECLESLWALDYPQDRVQTILVDNASIDGTVEAVTRQFPEVRVIASPDNLGFAAGNNAGIAAALDMGADYLFLVNNDAIVEKGALTRLVEAAMRESAAGFLGPKIYHREDPRRIQSAGTVSDRFWRFRQRGLNELDEGQFDKEEEVDALVGCALLVSRKAIEKIGLLDTRYYMYHEDIDWCCRARAHGFKVLYVPEAKVWHRDSQIRAADLPRMIYYITRNTYLFLSKQRGAFLAYAQTTLQNLVWLLNWTLNPKWRHKREERDALFKALVDALLGHYGKQAYRYGL